MPHSIDSVQRRRYQPVQPYRTAPRSYGARPKRGRRVFRRLRRLGVAVLLLALIVIYGPGLFHAKTFSFSRIFGITIAASDPKSEAEVVTQTAKFKSDAKLQGILDTYAQTTGTTSSVVIYDLDRHTVASINPDQTFFPASIYKLFVAERIYDLRAKGQLDFAKKITVSSAAAAQDAGTLIWPVGTKVTVQQCLTRMIEVSDNTCGSLLGSLAGWSGANPALQAMGYSATSLDNSLTKDKALTKLSTSARDVANLLAAVAQGALVDGTASSDLSGLLKAQTINGRLTRQLPAGVMGHKTGDYAGYFHDAGFVDSGGHSYVIAVLSGPWNSQKSADAAIGELSRKVYDTVMSR